MTFEDFMDRTLLVHITRHDECHVKVLFSFSPRWRLCSTQALRNFHCFTVDFIAALRNSSALLCFMILAQSKDKDKEEFECPTNAGNGNFADPVTCRRFYQVSRAFSPTSRLRFQFWFLLTVRRWLSIPESLSIRFVLRWHPKVLHVQGRSSLWTHRDKWVELSPQTFESFFMSRSLHSSRTHHRSSARPCSALRYRRMPAALLLLLKGRNQHPQGSQCGRRKSRKLRNFQPESGKLFSPSNLGAKEHKKLSPSSIFNFTFLSRERARRFLHIAMKKLGKLWRTLISPAVIFLFPGTWHSHFN